MDNFEQFIPNVHFELIPIKNLVSNQEYQRIISHSHIDRTADDFDVCQINPVKVSRRDGVNYVFNGQHTIEIVALVSGSRDCPVWCMIYDDLTYEQEAEIFSDQMKHAKALMPYEKFNAKIEAGREAQLMIKQLVESYGLEVGIRKSPGVVGAVSTLESIYEKYGYHVLNRTLRLVIATWEGETNSLSANMLNAVAKLIVTYNGILDEELFREKLGNVSVKTLIRTGKERRPGSFGLAEAMILIYNGKKKINSNKLFINRLYAKDFTAIIDDEDFANDDNLDLYQEPTDEEFDDYEPVSELDEIIEKTEE